MKHVIVYAHPNTESFNHAILETVKSELAEKVMKFAFVIYTN